MLRAVYNSAIPNLLSLDRVSRCVRRLRVAAQLSYFLLGMAFAAHAVDWSGPEQELSRKIVAVTGPGAVALTIEHRSSLGKRDNEVIQNGLRSSLESLGIRFVDANQAAATVVLSLSENQSSYVWVAQIRQGTADPMVVMTSVPRSEGATATHEAVPLNLRKIALWSQNDPILDVTVLEENTIPTHIAVLEAEKVTLYRFQSGKWQQERSFVISHAKPWPRDLRGRLVASKDHLFDVYLPGVLCRMSSGALTLNCRETDDPWPLVPVGLIGGAVSNSFSAGPALAIPPLAAFYAATRNFFTGVLTPAISKSSTVPKFYSAAFVPREKYVLWLFAAADGRVHMADGVTDQIARADWGSDVASLKTVCGAGWQVLAVSSDATGDSIRAYEFPDRDPVAVTASVGFQGQIMTALWTEAKGDTAIAIVRHRETGNYEAFRLAVDCNQ